MARIGESVRAFSEIEAMTMTAKPNAHYASVAQHPFDNTRHANLLTGAAIAYAIIGIGLAAMLVFSKAPEKAAPGRIGADTPSIAGDLAAIPAGLPIGVIDGTGYAGLEPPPAAPALPFASSDATAKQAHESPEQRNTRVAARSFGIMGE
jgi:hypothetical protein